MKIIPEELNMHDSGLCHVCFVKCLGNKTEGVSERLVSFARRTKGHITDIIAQREPGNSSKLKRGLPVRV